MSETKLKTFLGRNVKEEKVIPGGSGIVQFGALYEVDSIFNREGYAMGSVDENNPIGFWYNDGRLRPGIKWHSMSKEDKDKLDGLLVSECFRTKDVKIIFFDNE